MIDICEVPIRCPIHKIPLVRIPKPIADDVVVCPDCGAGGPYEQVVEKGAGLISPYLPLGTLQELLREAGSRAKRGMTIASTSFGSIYGCNLSSFRSIFRPFCGWNGHYE